MIITGELNHKCAELSELIDGFDGNVDNVIDWGWNNEDIKEINFAYGMWFASNGEYAALITYCPFCGILLGENEDVNK